MPEVTQQVLEPGSTQVLQFLSAPGGDLVWPPGSPGSRREPLLGLWSAAYSPQLGVI